VIVDLVEFDALPEMIRSIGTRRFQRLSAAGLAPAMVKFTPYKPKWSLSSCQRWLNDKLEPLSAQARPAALIPTFDGEPDDPRGETTP
jgi:hypothetical protein